jgi:penicillin-binding protein 2
LFVGYAPAEDPQIAISVVVEHGGYGGSAAAPIARAVFDAWLLGKLPEGLEPLDGTPADPLEAAAPDGAEVAATGAGVAGDVTGSDAAGGPEPAP